MKGTAKEAPDTLELTIAAQVTLLVIGVSWAFGGNADWVRAPISAGATLGVALTLVILLRSRSRSRVSPRTWWWAAPILLLNLLVAISCLRPGARVLTYGQSTYLLPLATSTWLPTSATPAISLRSLWLFDGLYFSCLNLALAVHRRTTLRRIMAVLLANAVALAVFGTAQKLAGATGLYFGAVQSPQVHFFSSFVYDNHWGAFAILMSALCLGMTLRYAQGSLIGSFFQGPVMAGLMALVLLAISVPYSGSRACSFLLVVLLAIALPRGLPTIIRALGGAGVSSRASWVGIAASSAVALSAVWLVAGSVITARSQTTQSQWAAMVAQGGIGSRSVLYHDTWRMAQARPLFGWGMGSFPTVFQLYSTQESKLDHIPIVYHDAHSDWLQSLAELGFVGTALLGLSVLIPLRTGLNRSPSTLPYLLLTGCVLVAAYAWIEFPFGNVAVVLAWWLCFFSAVRYVQLSRSSARASR